MEDCGSDNEEVLTTGEEGIPRWPYRFEALIKPRSPLSSVISLCNDQVYPTDQGKLVDLYISGFDYAGYTLQLGRFLV